MSEVNISLQPIDTQTVPEPTPKDKLVADLSRNGGLIATEVTRNNLGNAINLIVTEVYPSQLPNRIVAKNLETDPQEKSLPIQRVAPPRDLVIELNKRNIVPVSLQLLDLGDKQLAHLGFDLNEIIKQSPSKSPKLEELPVSIFDLQDIAEIFKEIGDKAQEVQNNQWNSNLMMPIDGPTLTRETEHGQTWESFAGALNKASGGKLVLRETKYRERLTRDLTKKYKM